MSRKVYNRHGQRLLAPDGHPINICEFGFVLYYSAYVPYSQSVSGLVWSPTTEWTAGYTRGAALTLWMKSSWDSGQLRVGGRRGPPGSTPLPSVSPLSALSLAYLRSDWFTALHTGKNLDSDNCLTSIHPLDMNLLGSVIWVTCNCIKLTEFFGDMKRIQSVHIVYLWSWKIGKLG